MYNKNNKKKIVTVIIIFVFVFLILFYSLILNRDMTTLEKAFKDVFVVVEKCIMYPFTALNSEKDKDQTKSYVIEKNVNVSLEKEIEELKDVLELNKTMSEYKTINGTVLSRNKSYWFNTITIDKGSRDGIKKDMAVVTRDGLVGKTSKVTYNSTEVKLITSDDLNYKVSVSIATDSGDSYAILSGYDKKNGTVKVTGVSNDLDVKKNDVVTTSGLGGLFPRGIYVGVVDKIKTDKYGISKTLYIKTKEDFNTIHYVTVLGEIKWLVL